MIFAAITILINIAAMAGSDSSNSTNRSTEGSLCKGKPVNWFFELTSDDVRKAFGEPGRFSTANGFIYTGKLNEILREVSMFCDKCGANLPEEAVFCNKCGNRNATLDSIQTTPTTATGFRQFDPLRRFFSGGLGKKILIVVGIILAIIILVSVFSSDANVKMLTESHMSACPQKTVGQMVNGFFASPSWSSGIAHGNKDIPDGVTFVNLKGKIAYMDKPVEATLQFVFSEDNSEFSVQALEFNGIPQNQLMIWGLLEKMCE